MIREPVVAGQFYSGDPRTLRRVVDSFLESPPVPLEARAVVAPHAGYVYSGSVAGAVFGSVRLPKRFIILGPNHTGRGAALALAAAGEWATPLGKVTVDEQLNKGLLEECPQLREDKMAHAREHSLEVQIPFLQARAGSFSFSAICVGTTDYHALESLGLAMARAVAVSPVPVLMISSSDMNHYESAEIASRKDQLAIDRILSLDPRGLHAVVREHDISMCGFAPTVAVLKACLELGATGAKLVRYANSGDVSGDYDSVVGYAGIAIF